MGMIDVLIILIVLEFGYTLSVQDQIKQMKIEMEDLEEEVKKHETK